MCSGRYEDALAIYDRLRPKLEPKDWRHVSERGTVLMALRRYKEAETEFKLASDCSVRESRGESQSYLEMIAAAQWLTGRLDEAAATWKSEVDGLLSRKIKYADLSGGVGPAMLLWFAGKSLGKQEFVDRSMKLIERLSKTSRIQYWPGPLALFVLGKESFPNVVKMHFKHIDLNRLLAAAEDDRLFKRELCQSLFYWSFSERESGGRDRAFQLLKACVELEMPLEVEWFVARGMLDKMQ